MTPATRRAIESLEYIADQLADTARDDIAQLAKRAARMLADEYLSAKPSDAEQAIDKIRKIVGVR